ncbi:MAG: YgaP family membrane protein [Mycobacterium sp.]
MKKNMGTVDRVVRILAALAVVVLFLTHAISGPLALILGLVAAVLVLTSFVGVCPLYIPLKLSTAARN